jgi:hypothetical protein
MFLHMFYSLDWFHVYTHVLMMYYECYYLNKSNNFKINLNYHFKTWQTKHRSVHLLWLMLGGHTFYYFCSVFSFLFHFSMLIWWFFYFYFFVCFVFASCHDYNSFHFHLFVSHLFILQLSLLSLICKSFTT